MQIYASTLSNEIAFVKQPRKSHEYVKKPGGGLWTRRNSCLPATCLTCPVIVYFSSAALEVELSDDSFPPEDFGIVSGMLNVKWDRIAPYP